MLARSCDGPATGVDGRRVEVVDALQQQQDLSKEKKVKRNARGSDKERAAAEARGIIFLEADKAWSREALKLEH